MPETYDLPNAFCQALLKTEDTRCQFSVEYPCKWKWCFWQLLNIELFSSLRIFYYLQSINWLAQLSDEDRCPRLR